jgi:hypothetical protein
LDDLVGNLNAGPPLPGSVGDLVNRTPADPVLAALQAAGYPTSPTTGIPTGPGLQPVGGGAPAQPTAGGGPDTADQGPVTSPDQLPQPKPQPTAVPAAMQPTTNQPGAPVVPVTPAGQPLASGDVKGATKEQNAALADETQRVMATELAKTDALAAHANARATIYEGHATAQGLVDKQYEVARQAARNDANAETAAWQRDLDKKVSEEPVAGRWWAEQSRFGQVMYLLSLTFGAMAQAKNPNLKNIALEMITKEMDDDVAEQRDRIKREIEGLKLKGQKIDEKMQARIADARDDHTLLSSRLAIVQQAALERANAPGPADQRAAMAEAAQWAGQQRLNIAGERANRAYAEREGALNRDAENARALLTDKRDRDLKAAELQKDYDLARIQAQVKLSGKDDPRIKNSVVLNPFTTGIRVVNQAGQPVATPLSENGGLTVAKETEKEARQVADLAQDDYATMNRVSRELGKGEDINVLFKRNPQLVSDLIKLGYGAARNKLDPNGRVTDKDFQAGLENAIGGDLDSLHGRLAAGAHISADTGKLKALVDKQIRDYPKFVSNRLGALIDAAVPGYEGDIRVDWSPKSVETEPPANPSTQEIDATYGIRTPVKPPETLGDLKNAQDLESKGIKALPPYRPGSQDKVLKAIEDFKGATVETIQKRAGIAERQLDEAGDKRAALEVQQAQYKAIDRAREAMNTVEDDLRVFGPRTADHRIGGPPLHNDSVLNYKDLQASPEGTKVYSALSSKEEEAWNRGEVPIKAVAEIAAAHGLTQLTSQDVLDIIKKVGLKPYKE